MYLLVFVILVISLIGTYAQMLSVQAARIAASQHSIASAMLNWHSAAVSMGASVATKSPGYTVVVGTAGCHVSFSYLTPTTIVPCPAPAGVPLGTITDGGGNRSNIINKSGATEVVHLPAAYDAMDYQFYSLLYQDANGQNYVVTFVPKPNITAANPAPGFVALPIPGGVTTRLTGLTQSDLVQQLRNTGLDRISYGTVKTTGGVTVLTTGNAVQQFQYTLPASSIGDDSIAIVSSLSGF